jgi:hypothetical protein
MQFAKVVFWIAAIWGILVITPLYFLYDTIGRQDPPAITHPGFYYGFAGCALAWQFAFNSHRERSGPLPRDDDPSVFEKFTFAAAQTVLYIQHRIHPSDLAVGGIDGLHGTLFLLAYFRTSAKTPSLDRT